MPTTTRTSRPAWAAAVALLAALPFLSGSFWGPENHDESDALLFRVQRGAFVHEVEVEGEIQSAACVEVACEVRTYDASWIRILEVVPEGTRVEQGDFLVRLDSSALEQERDRQQLACDQAMANLNRAEATLRTAQYNKEHYLAGEYAVARSAGQLDVLTGREQVRVARETLRTSGDLLLKGFITPRQYIADQSAVRRYESDLRAMELKVEVLDRYTRPRRLIELESALVVAKARVVIYRNAVKRNTDRLADVNTQIARCVIRAPVAGEVVLAHLDHGDHMHMVVPGELTMEHRVLVRLPDPGNMQVRVEVPENKIAAIHRGVKAAIELGAFPGQKLTGEVVRVNEYPLPETWFGTAVKKYETVIRIDHPLPGMRPGLSADVTIAVERLEDEVQVPCQSVFWYGDQSYSIRVQDGVWDARPVTLGPSNGKTVVIREGLDPDDVVVLGAGVHRKELGLPPIPGEDPDDSTHAFALAY